MIPEPKTTIVPRRRCPLLGTHSAGVLAAVAVLAGAIQTASAEPSPLSAKSPVAAATAPTASPQPPARQRPASRAYTMTAEELALDCGKLAGRIRVRIRQLRASMSEGQTTALARGLQAAATPIVGGTLRGIDPSADLAQELGQVEAYNGRLREKNCPSYDLDAEFAPGNMAAPKLLRPAKTAPAKASPQPTLTR
ncbi:MAG: hypothetical protein K2Y05_00155 [Hyphomicrobiaceae bacterium]|nr:hypothetical protein [Hyphomicrobiaceae bacterium]